MSEKKWTLAMCAREALRFTEDHCLKDDETVQVIIVKGSKGVLLPDTLSGLYSSIPKEFDSAHVWRPTLPEYEYEKV